MTRFKLLAGSLALAVCIYPLLAKKKKPEEITQTLALPQDPPATVTAETSRLVFHVSPLSAKGLLSQQVRDALKALLKSTGSASIVKLRLVEIGRFSTSCVGTVKDRSPLVVCTSGASPGSGSPASCRSRGTWLRLPLSSCSGR